MSMHPSRTERHTMKIKNIKTGLVTKRQPPDASEMVATGGWEFVPASTRSIAEILAMLGPVELNRLAAEAGVRTYNERPEDIITALVPFVEQGVVELPKLKTKTEEKR